MIVNDCSKCEECSCTSETVVSEFVYCNSCECKIVVDCALCDQCTCDVITIEECEQCASGDVCQECIW